MPAHLTINGDSSSIRFALRDADESLRLLLRGKTGRLDLGDTNLSSTDSVGILSGSPAIDVDQHVSAVTFVVDWLEAHQAFPSVERK